MIDCSLTFKSLGEAMEHKETLMTKYSGLLIGEPKLYMRTKRKEWTYTLAFTIK